MCTMDEIFYGSIWCMVGTLLTTDDAVRLRVVAIRWNEGSRHGEMGEFYIVVNNTGADGKTLEQSSTKDD